MIIMIFFFGLILLKRRIVHTCVRTSIHRYGSGQIWVGIVSTQNCLRMVVDFIITVIVVIIAVAAAAVV